MIHKTIQLRAAYGRTYMTQKSFKKDFNECKDFSTNPSGVGAYCSKADLPILAKEYETIYYNFGSSIVYVVRFGKIANWVNEELINGR